MRRREFITLVGGAAAWPLAARSQEARKLPTIGFMGSDAAFFSPWTAAFAGRLRELGWVEGRTISIEYRWSEGRPERVDAIAAEFVGLNVDVIVTAGGAAAAFKRATSVIPIVFAVATDPLGSGLVDSLARPGGNVTGLSNLQAELAGKRLESIASFHTAGSLRIVWAGPFCPSAGSGKPVITAAVLPGAAITGPSPLGRGPPAAPVAAGDSHEKNRPPRTRRTGASASG